MKLPRTGREYAYWPVTHQTGSLINWEVQIDPPLGVWVAAELITDKAVLAAANISADAAVRVLVYGPDAADKTKGFAITNARTKPLIRCVGGEEVLIRQGDVTLSLV